MLKPILAAVCVLGTAAGMAQGQPNLLQHGLFDGFAPGTWPDCGIAAGAWQFAAPTTCELAATDFQIVPTSTFDPGSAGASLAQDVVLLVPPPPVDNAIVLRNVLTTPITPTPGRIALLEFDLWVVAGFSGGNVWFGDTFNDARGPQLGWHANGHFTISSGPCPVVLLDSYPADAWQRVRVIVDLNAQNYDVWWSLRAGTPVRLAERRQFWGSCSGAPCPLSQISRFAFVRFADGLACTEPLGATRSYLDNVAAYDLPDCNGNRLPDHEDIAAGRSCDHNANGIPDECECYANCDCSTTSPTLNVQDFTCFLQRYAAGEPYANCDGSTVAPVLNVQDFTCFLQSYAAGCP